MSGPVAEGILLSAPRALDRPATRVRARLAARTGDGGTATAQVRGWRARGWTEWRDAAEAVFDEPVSRVQARVVLTTRDAASATPTPTTGPNPQRRPGATTAVQAATPRTYRVYATRIGLVGDITANGYVIAPRDHFVALPTARPVPPMDTGDRTVPGLHHERQPLRLRPGLGRRPVEHPGRLVEPERDPGGLGRTCRRGSRRPRRRT